MITNRWKNGGRNFLVFQLSLHPRAEPFDDKDILIREGLEELKSAVYELNKILKRSGWPPLSEEEIESILAKNLANLLKLWGFL